MLDNRPERAGPPPQTVADAVPSFVHLLFLQNSAQSSSLCNEVIRIEHTAYCAGSVRNGGQCGSCIAYGRWRSYYIDTSGDHDAVLEVGLSRLLHLHPLGSAAGDAAHAALRGALAARDDTCQRKFVRRERADALALSPVPGAAH